MIDMTERSKKFARSQDAALLTAAGVISPKEIAEGRSPRQIVADAKRAGGFAWIGLVNPSSEEVEDLGAALKLPPLAVRDASGRGQQPKVQFYGGHLFVVMWSLKSGESKLRFDIVETFIFAMGNVLVTIQYGDAERHQIREALQTEASGAVGVIGGAYKVMAGAAAQYTEAAHRIEDELEELEDQVFDPALPDEERRIYGLRRHIGRVDRGVSGLTRSLERAVDDLQQSAGNDDALIPFLRDLLDDLVGTQQLANDQHQALDGIIATHENSVASQQNRDSRKISAVAALIAAPAVIAGIYGMNFKNLPGVSSPFGFAIIMGGIAVVVLCLGYLFRRAHWL